MGANIHAAEIFVGLNGSLSLSPALDYNTGGGSINPARSEAQLKSPNEMIEMTDSLWRRFLDGTVDVGGWDMGSVFIVNHM
jgi:hypothetical protein